LTLNMNGLVVLAACVCASSAQLYASPAWAPTQSHQFHAQDEFGQYSFGHAGGPSARTESKNAYGVVTGSYQQIDANGLLQTVNYVADGLGFRVTGTNLPVAAAAAPVVPLEAPVFNLVGPDPVQDTPEVAAAKAAHAEALAAAEAAAAAAPEERKRRDADEVVAAAAVPALGLPYPYAFGAAAFPAAAFPAATFPAAALPAAALPAAPLPAAALPYNAVSAPASREATLTTIKLNPGHATFYRVD